MTELFGEIFDIKRFALHDGPGIRCTAFLKGCPLSCIWCHNPESQRSGPEICSNPQACIHCGKCISVCPNQALQFADEKIEIDRNRCNRCGKCSNCCPAKALTLKGYQISDKALMQEFKKESVFFASSGGITLSGGEPLLQADFSRSVLQKSKEHNFHTAIESCLFASTEVLESLIDFVDLWICDIKLYDEDEHKKLTGSSNRIIFQNYEYLLRRNCQILTRIPVIPSCTDSEKNLFSIGKYIALNNPEGSVELMFYNPLGESKYKSYGMDYKLNGVDPYIKQEQENFKKIVASTGIKNIL